MRRSRASDLPSTSLYPFRGQILCGRIREERGGIPTVPRTISSRPNLLTSPWYPYGFAVHFFVTEFSDTAAVSPVLGPTSL